MSETPRKRRPETDGLRQLKKHTENRLDVLKKLECIPTKQAEEAKKLLERRRSIVIKGNPGEGKTTTALHLIDNERYRDRRVVLSNPRDCEKLDTDYVDIVVLEDIFGQFDHDHGRLQKWMVYLPTIQEHLDAGKLEVIVTTRVDVLSKAYSMVRSMKLFSDDLSLTLSSKQLTYSEKMSILNRELHRNERNMNEDEKENCISNFTGMIGFPQCCLLFAGDSKLFDRGPEFFRFPKTFFVANITDLEKTKFLSLAFLFCNGQIHEEDLSSKPMPESSKHLLMELASHLQIPEKEASVTSVRDAYDSLLGLYVVKCMPFDNILVPIYEGHYIMFTHDTVLEAVGQVLGDQCVEMVVKYGDLNYLYQRTYTAETKDSTSDSVFIPVSLYGLLAERMVCDVKEELAGSIVKHSALKKPDFLMKLKDEVCKGNGIEDFFKAGSFLFEDSSEDEFEDDLDLDDENHPLSKGKCQTFMQYMLQNDEDVVTLVYSHFLEFLTCAHADDSLDCWQCEEKQTLLELALYYNHFQIADKLITLNANYTNVSLSNAARHGDLHRVLTILETLKSSQVFNPECKEAKYALCRAFKSGNQSLIEILLKEGIILDSMHVLYAVQHGDLNVLKRIVEHLKSHNKWKPQIEQYLENIEPQDFNQHSNNSEVELQIPSTKALYITYHNEMFDMADYLLKNEVKISMYMLAYVSKNSSQQAIARVIQNLKDTGSWDPDSDDMSETLEEAYGFQRYDFCDLLVQEGVPPRMENLLHVTAEHPFRLKPIRPVVRLETVKKVIQHLKDTDNWDPRCKDAYNALQTAFAWQKDDVFDLLVQEGVSLTMRNFHDVVFSISIESVKKAIKLMKDTDDWDPKCNEASETLTEAYIDKKDYVCDLLAQEGVPLKIKNFFHMVLKVSKLETIKKAIQHMKNTDNWDPKCLDASLALSAAYEAQKYDVWDLLVQEGCSLKMENFPSVVKFSVSFEYLKKQIQLLKDTNSWDPKCDDASEALAEAYIAVRHDMCILLEQDGISLKMENLPVVVSRSSNWCCAVMQRVKDPDNWGLKSDRLTYWYWRKVIKHLKETNNWDPKCDDASEALKIAYENKMFDLCYQLVREGTFLKLKDLPDVINTVSFSYYDQAIQHKSGPDYRKPNFDQLTFSYFDEEIPPMKAKDNFVCFLLNLEGVSLTMKNLPEVENSISVHYYKKVIQHLKDTNNWDPKCDDASQALIDAYEHNMDNVHDLLVMEGVSVKMKNLFDVVLSTKTIRKVIEHLKDTDDWDPKCDGISEALALAYSKARYDLCDLLVQEGVTLAMKNLPAVTTEFPLLSLKSVKKAIKVLKNSKNWDPKCDDASQALEDAYNKQEYDLCDLLEQEGVSLNMKNLPHVIASVSIKYLKKAIQQMKDNDNWKPKCDDASEALVFAYCEQRNGVCDLLVLEGVSLTMKNLIALTSISDVSLKSIRKVIQHLKDTENWDPMCDDASQALANACSQQYNVCDLLVNDGVSLKMKNLPDMVYSISLEYFERAVQHMKDTDNWDPNFDKACKLLADNVSELKKFDFLNIWPARLGLHITLKSVKKAIQHLKDVGNWDPMCDDASQALANVFCQQDDSLCDLLVQEGVFLTMKNLSDMVYSISFKYFKKAVQHLKDTGNWDPKCDDALQLLANANSEQMYDACDLLVQEGVTLTMKNPSCVVHSVSVVKKAIQYFKKTGMLSIMQLHKHEK